MEEIYKAEGYSPPNYIPQSSDVVRRDFDAILKENERLQGKVREYELRENFLHESMERYRTMFEESPVPMIEKDFSGVKKFVDNLKKSGTKDIEKYFDDNPDALQECATLVRIIDVNKSAITHFNAINKKDFLSNFHELLCEKPCGILINEITAVVLNCLHFETDCTTHSFNGERSHAALKLIVPSRYKDTWDRMLVTVIDITERKKLEDTLHKSNELCQARFGDACIALKTNTAS